VALAILAVALPQLMCAQGIGNSPYSLTGVGDIVDPAFIPATAMGGVGASHTSSLFINNINPALLARSQSTIFEVGASAQYQHITSGTASQRDFGGNLRYLAYAFPVSRRWTVSAGLRPYSNVGFRTNTTGNIQGIPPDGVMGVNQSYTGTGGLSSVDLTNGFYLFKGLYVGLQASYIFGNITKETISQLRNDTLPVNQEYQIAFVSRTNYAGFQFRPGLAYRQQLNEKIFVNVGAVYTLNSSLNATQLIGFQSRTAGGQALQMGYDTISSGLQNTVRLPSNYRFGFSFDRPYHWAVAADVAFNRGAEFVDFNGSQPLQNGYSVHLGGEFTPNISSISSYWSRVTYRAGINYSQTPFISNGLPVNDFGINFGTSFPIGRGVSNMNLAFTLGQRGALMSDNTSIKEQYFRLGLGFTLSGLYDRWFVRSKID
jgi:hypothetical protein